MAGSLDALKDAYQYYWIDKAESRTQHYVFLSSPWPMLTLLTFYFYFIYYGGRKFMENKKPIDLTSIMVFYNIFQTTANAFLCFKGVELFISYKGSLTCIIMSEGTDDDNTNTLFDLSHYFLVLKLIDLADTVFMVLRKKHSQVSLLHVYHHGIVAFMSWIMAKYNPGGQLAQAALFCWLNTFVHTIMYFYYYMSVKYPQLKQNYWKRHITHLQMIQFIFAIIHLQIGISDPDCKISKKVCMLFQTQLLFMLVMFAKFYYSTYIKSKDIVKSKLN